MSLVLRRSHGNTRHFWLVRGETAAWTLQTRPTNRWSDQAVRHGWRWLAGKKHSASYLKSMKPIRCDGVALAAFANPTLVRLRHPFILFAAVPQLQPADGLLCCMLTPLDRLCLHPIIARLLSRSLLLNSYPPAPFSRVCDSSLTRPVSIPCI